jgi:hypothetical protein
MYSFYNMTSKCKLHKFSYTKMVGKFLKCKYVNGVQFLILSHKSTASSLSNRLFCSIFAIKNLFQE